MQEFLQIMMPVRQYTAYQHHHEQHKDTEQSHRFTCPTHQHLEVV